MPPPIEDTTITQPTETVTDPPKVEAPEDKKPEGAAPEAKPEGADDKAEESKPETRKAADGDDIDVDDKGTVTMPFASFQRRLTRAANQATKSMLREVFGTDNATEIKKLVKTGKDAQATLEKSKREQMTEVEKLKDDNERLRRKAEEAEEKARAYEEDQLANKGESIVTGVASKYISADYVEDAVAVYQRKLAKMDEDELDSITPADVDEHFKEYAAKKPALARKPGERRKVQEAASNGPDPTKKPEPVKAGSATGKTPKPNQPNSMTKQEFETYKRERGLNF